MKIKKHKKPAREPKKPLDRFSASRRSRRRRPANAKASSRRPNPDARAKLRGRPPKIPTGWVMGRAYNHRLQLTQIWTTLEGPLLKAKSAEDVTTAFREHGSQYADQFVPGFAADILALIRDRKFPKRPAARVNFLADSLGGRPSVSSRTSRDICERERAKQRRKSPHHIIRKEYYVECSCGYRGPARNDACRKCGAEISFSLEELTARGLL